MSDLMLDIETLGTASNSVITQIGACYFDRITGVISDEFLVNIQVQDSINNGFVIDGGSLRFWFELTGSNPAKNYIPSWFMNPQTVSKALALFRDFCHKNKTTKLIAWAHATFDFPLLQDAYNRMNQGFPIPYRRLRDIRTLVDLSGIEYKKDKDGDPKTHDALDDCRYQVKYCSECFRKLAGLPIGDVPDDKKD